MKLLRAKENLQADLLRPGSVDKVDFQAAEQMGIEAIECVRKIRHHPFPDEVLQLPSETPE